MALPERVNRLMEKNIKYIGTYYIHGSRWELKGQGHPSTLHCRGALEVTSLQFTPTPALVLPIYSRMTVTKPLELVVFYCGHKQWR